jgi:ABC-2 type transport system ATP-binding protein
VYGLLGPNGSGKTTLIRMLVGLARPTAGRARVLGLEMPSRAALSRVGYMTQADGIYLDLSVWENLRFFADLYGVTDRAAIDEVLELVELGDRRSTPAADLSGGLRRRLSLACSLVHRPSVLLLDEPTVGVDPVLRVGFWDHFRRLAAGGVTLLISSHVMDEAERCDELLLILHGRLLAQGSADAVRARAGTTDLESAFLRLGEVNAER